MVVVAVADNQGINVSDALLFKKGNKDGFASIKTITEPGAGIEA